ncbi:lycopene cyclase family protein [Flavobacterium sp. ASW18X]|uniref:lycopene cyclase family protein n=1 Tax=Flavobacterium sp. ASW18X TaxID=2572595 RepID=UPI0010AE4328|nr:lycopene cyclase family protein [Flavobacterium sp. ASW18X]TKD67300.1 lycopene cyclase [Flavobacterium sp. ASW18X]
MHYNYVIVGAGAAGLLLLKALAEDSFFNASSILVIDKSAKTENDRTWCFWEKDQSDLDAYTYKKWSNIRFKNTTFNTKENISPYYYKMIRGIDFYNKLIPKLKAKENIEFLQGTVTAIVDNQIKLANQTQTIRADKIFDSRFNYKDLLSRSKFPVLQQHFIGWHIKTDQAVFGSDTATFMDFSVPQKENTRFMYVLPFAENEALVEYTLFSATPLATDEYESAITNYLSKLGVTYYKVIAKEKGNIPMTCHPFHKENTGRYLKIGIAGGWAKPSTGYTFYNSKKQVTKLVNLLKSEKPLHHLKPHKKFWFYDVLLLDILDQKNNLGSPIFSQMFQKRPAKLILKFLDEETNLWEDLQLIWACPKKPFIQALLKRVKSGF